MNSRKIGHARKTYFSQTLFLAGIMSKHLVLGAASSCRVISKDSSTLFHLETLREGKSRLKEVTDNFFLIHGFPFPKSAGNGSS